MKYQTGKIREIFDFIPETNLTEEYFYEHLGEYPVFSGQTDRDGVIAFIDTYNNDEELITFTTYGVGAGKLFFRSGKFTIGRNCMGLRVKDHIKDHLLLEWFSFKYQNYFYRLRIGDITGQRSLNKLLLENQIIALPDIKIQERELKIYHEAINNKYEVMNKIKTITEIFNFRIQYCAKKIETTEMFKNIFNIEGGNGGLTEEFIYHNQPYTLEEGIPIYSSATLSRTSMGIIDKNALPNAKKLKVFKAPCVLVARNGYAGSMNYFEKGEFTTNDHAYVITLKNKWKNKVDLRWFVFQYQELFFNIVTSKSDNATFSKELIQEQLISIPHYNDQIKISPKLKEIDKTLTKLNKRLIQIEDLIGYQII